MMDRLHQLALQLDAIAEARAVARAQAGPLQQKRFEAIARVAAAAEQEFDAVGQRPEPPPARDL